MIYINLNDAMKCGKIIAKGNYKIKNLLCRQCIDLILNYQYIINKELTAKRNFKNYSKWRNKKKELKLPVTIMKNLLGNFWILRIVNYFKEK